MITDKAINGQQFIEFIQMLRQGNQDQRICVFMDNSSVHKSLNVRQRIGAL